MTIARVFSEIIDERMIQDVEHGGPSHDDELELADWIVILTRHLGFACGDKAIIEPDRLRKQMRRVASVAVAAIESMDRKSNKVQEFGPSEFGKQW